MVMWYVSGIVNSQNATNNEKLLDTEMNRILSIKLTDILLNPLC